MDEQRLGEQLKDDKKCIFFPCKKVIDYSLPAKKILKKYFLIPID
jgi:hypothetical protein